MPLSQLHKGTRKASAASAGCMWHAKGLSGAAASAGCWNASGPGCRISDASSGSECLDPSKSLGYFTACQDTGGGIPGQHFLFRNSSDNTTMAIRTADGRGCLSWRSSSAGPANSAGAQVAARPCDAADPSQQWRLTTAAVPEDSAHTFLTPHGHCIHAAPYGKGNIRYQTPPVVGAWSCDDEDPALKWVVAAGSTNGAQQLVWRQDPARCATTTASGEVTLQPCAPSVTSQLWTAKAGQIVSKADGRCLSAGCRGCKVSLASCSGGAPAGNTQWRVTEAGAVASGAGLCLGANPATTIENLTVVGSAPVEVGRASDSWFFFPDKLAAFPPFWNGSGIFEQSDRETPAAVLIGVTTSSDDFHDQGWTGRHFVSRDDGLTFKEIDNTEHESWRDAHMCLPWNDSATRNPSLLCTPFTSKCKPEDAPCKASSTAYVNGTVYEHDVAAGTVAPVASTLVTFALGSKFNFTPPNTSAPCGNNPLCCGCTFITNHTCAGPRNGTCNMPHHQPTNDRGYYSLGGSSSGRIRRLRDGRGGFAQLADFSPSLPQPVHGATLLWSVDGLVWSALGTIPPGICNGVGEGDWDYLPDGKTLYAILRNSGPKGTLCESFSHDQGRTWSVARETNIRPGVSTVSPRLATLPNGLMVISSGRVGLFAWVSQDSAKTWASWNLAVHHNSYFTDPHKRYSEAFVRGSGDTVLSTSYTSMIVLPGRSDTVLVCYDRLGNGWDPAPGPYGPFTAVYCTRLTFRLNAARALAAPPAGPPNCNIRPGIMPDACANYSIGVYNMAAAPTCCTDPLAQRPSWIFTTEPVCQWATPVLLPVPNITVGNRSMMALLALSEARMGANFSERACSSGSAPSLWQRPGLGLETAKHSPGVRHHSIVASDPAAARAPPGSAGLLLGSAVYDPESTRAHLFYTTACDSTTSCAIAPRRALHIRSETLNPWPGNDSNAQMPAWSLPSDITSALAAHKLHMLRFGVGTGLHLGAGRLLVCGVTLANANTTSISSSGSDMACVVATDTATGPLTLRPAARFSYQGGVQAVSLTGPLRNGSIVFSLRVAAGLLFAISDDQGDTVVRSSLAMMPLPATSCNGALAVHNGQLVLARSIDRQMSIMVYNDSSDGRSWSRLAANLWPSGQAGCSAVVSMGNGQQLGLLFEQRFESWPCQLANAPEQILFSLVPAAMKHDDHNSASPRLIFVTSSGDNDWHNLLHAEYGGTRIQRAQSREKALELSARGDTLLLVADGFPHQQVPALERQFWARASAKEVKVFLEFPAGLPLNTTWRAPSLSAPCVSRPPNGTKIGTAVSFMYRNQDKNLCSDGNKWVHTRFTGHICNKRGDVQWERMLTVDPRAGLSPAACTWTGAGSSDPSVEYSGTCGVAPAGVQGSKQNTTAMVPVWMCPPANFTRAPLGGTWANLSPQGSPDWSVEECAAACRTTKSCKGFAVSDAAGCGLFMSSLQAPFTPSSNTTTFVVSDSSAHKPPQPVAVTLKRWTALRPSTGAQPASFRGVLAPRLPRAVAEAWGRVGMRPLDIFEHFATESTMPQSWATYGASFCEQRQHTLGSDPTDVDCTIEDSAQVHAYSTVAAGYDSAIFGIDTAKPPVVEHPSPPGSGNVPLLYELNVSGVPLFVSATKISDLVKHRFAPRDHWRAVFDFILQEFAKTNLRMPPWAPAVGPTYAQNESLPETWRADAVRRATDWLLLPRGPVACDPMPCTPVWDGGTCGTNRSCSSTSAGMSMIYQGQFMCGTQEHLPEAVRDAAICVIEGTNGVVFPNGSQQMLAGDRSDCNAEGAMAAAFRSVLESRADGDRDKAQYFRNVSLGLLRYIFDYSGSHINSSYTSWGHMKEQASIAAADGGNGPRVPEPVASDFYSDDNSRDWFGGLAAAALLNSSIVDDQLTTLALALLRTTGTDGFRPANINGGALESGGWRQFFERPHRIASDNPHFIAQMWALFFAAYRVTGISLFRQQALKGLGTYMTESFDPGKVFATESITEELSRLMLPLAWRIRVQDTPANRDDLRRVWAALNATWVPGVGVPTCTMSPFGQMCPPCSSNACYGNGERSVCQESGDPASDVLYESNFLLNNLIEAFAATGEAEYSAAAEQLSRYVARIQVKSDRFPHYSGTWFRAFDFHRWEVFGSSADWGWPAFGIETGWTVTWLTAGLGLRELKIESMWDLMTSRSLRPLAAKSCPRFFENLSATACRT